MYYACVDCSCLLPTGPAGREAGNTKPFERLNTNQMKQELHLRGEYDFGTTKQQLTQSLKRTLCGAQRVPSFILLNPTKTLSEMNLEH